MKMIINLIKYMDAFLYYFIQSIVCLMSQENGLGNYKTQQNVSHIKSSAIFYILILSTSFHDMTSS